MPQIHPRLHLLLGYDERMKSNPDTPNFEEALRQVLSVSKEELNRREAEYQHERAGKTEARP